MQEAFVSLCISCVRLQAFVFFNDGAGRLWMTRIRSSALVRLEASLCEQRWATGRKKVTSFNLWSVNDWNLSFACGSSISIRQALQVLLKEISLPRIATCNIYKMHRSVSPLPPKKHYLLKQGKSVWGCKTTKKKKHWSGVKSCAGDLLTKHKFMRTYAAVHFTDDQCKLPTAAQISGLQTSRWGSE